MDGHSQNIFGFGTPIGQFASSQFINSYMLQCQDMPQASFEVEFSVVNMGHLNGNKNYTGEFLYSKGLSAEGIESSGGKSTTENDYRSIIKVTSDYDEDTFTHNISWSF